MSQKKGTEGFYLDDHGQPQDERLHGSCEPSDPEAFNRGMWELWLERGLSEESLTQLYGPRPA